MNASRFLHNFPKRILSSGCAKSSLSSNTLECHGRSLNLVNFARQPRSLSTHTSTSLSSDPTENSVIYSATSHVRGKSMFTMYILISIVKCLNNYNQAIILLYEIDSSPFVSVQWKDLGNMEAVADVNEYPAVWLRDNCQCPSCYNKHANARLLLMKDLDVDVQPDRVSVQDNQVFDFEISRKYLIGFTSASDDICTN